jgi:hypothetical protein
MHIHTKILAFLLINMQRFTVIYSTVTHCTWFCVSAVFNLRTDAKNIDSHPKAATLTGLADSHCVASFCDAILFIITLFMSYLQPYY